MSCGSPWLVGHSWKEGTTRAHSKKRGSRGSSSPQGAKRRGMSCGSPWLVGRSWKEGTTRAHSKMSYPCCRERAEVKGLGSKRNERGAPRGSEWAKSLVGGIPDCETINDCRPRQRGRVAGVVESIKLVPRPETTRLEITITDGTGEISGVWFGQHRIAGLDLGQRVFFEGMVG